MLEWLTFEIELGYSRNIFLIFSKRFINHIISQLSLETGRIFCYLSKKHVSVFQTYLTRSSHRRCSIKKGALKNFVKFTEKHLRSRVSFNKVVGLRLSIETNYKTWTWSESSALAQV